MKTKDDAMAQQSVRDLQTEQTEKKVILEMKMNDIKEKGFWIGEFTTLFLNKLNKKYDTILVSFTVYVH